MTHTQSTILLALGLCLTTSCGDDQGAASHEDVVVASGDTGDDAAAPTDTAAGADTAPSDADAAGAADAGPLYKDTSDDGGDSAAVDAGPMDAGPMDAGAPDTSGGPPIVSSIAPPAWTERPATVYAPAGYDPQKAWPMVVLLHGYSASGFVQNLYLGLSDRTTKDGFVLVVPDGTKDTNGNLFWNATDYCCDFGGVGVDDVAYIGALMDEAEATLNIDAKRIYLVGHSNGGFMSYRMACEVGDRIAAIVSIAGATFMDESKCVGTARVSVLQVHGTDDDTILFDGTGGYPSAAETISRWTARDGCSEQTETAEAFDLDDAVPGDETQTTRWSACQDATTVELWTMYGSGHIPAFPADFSARAMQFLLSHTRP